MALTRFKCCRSVLFVRFFVSPVRIIQSLVYPRTQIIDVFVVSATFYEDKSRCRQTVPRRQVGRQEKLAGFAALLQFNAYFMEPAAAMAHHITRTAVWHHRHSRPSDGRLWQIDAPIGTLSAFCCPPGPKGNSISFALQ